MNESLFPLEHTIAAPLARTQQRYGVVGKKPQSFAADRIATQKDNFFMMRFLTIKENSWRKCKALHGFHWLLVATHEKCR